MTQPIVKQCPSCHKYWPNSAQLCEFCGASLYGSAPAPSSASSAQRAGPIPRGDDDVDPELLNHFRPAKPVIEPAAPARSGLDADLKRVRSNQYWVMRLHAKRMGLRAAVEVVVAVLAGMVSLAGLVMMITSSANQWTLGMFGGGAVVAYRQAMAAYATLMHRDELLMRIDVAMNTAIIAEHMTTQARK